MSINEITTLVENYREAAQLIEAAQAEQEAIKEQLKAELASRGVDSMDAGLFKVRCTTVITSRLDAKALKAAAPALAAQFTKTTTTQRFSIA